ncbi:MAG: hypothetical protein FK734_14240, partial [Asgard group archaeon]|nr:hypothetical protein [Asgard group archaeon]
MGDTIIHLTPKEAIVYDEITECYANIYATGWFFGLLSWLSLFQPTIISKYPQFISNFRYRLTYVSEDFDTCFDSNRITILGFKNYEGNTNYDYYYENPRIEFNFSYNKSWYDTLSIKQLLLSINIGVFR